MSGLLCKCPHCSADLRGPTIPEESREMFGQEGEECRGGCGAEPHFSRLISLYDQKKDRTVAWRCPNCTKEWPRG